MSACPQLECCTPSPFNTVGEVPVSVGENCRGVECCDVSPFSIIPNPPQIAFIAGEGAGEAIIGEGGEIILPE